MINLYQTQDGIEAYQWYEVPVTVRAAAPWENQVRDMVRWCEDHASTGLFRTHLTLKFPIYQGAFWFTMQADAIEFKLRWL